MSSLTEIAEGILADAKRIDAALSSQNLPPTSFDHDTLSSLPHDIDPIRKSLVDSTQALKRLTLGPVAHQLEICFGVSNHLQFSSRLQKLTLCQGCRYSGFPGDLSFQDTTMCPS